MLSTTIHNLWYNYKSEMQFFKEAKRLMTEQPEMSIEEVSQKSGFSYRRNFSRIFMQETGMSPSDWRINGDES